MPNSNEMQYLIEGSMLEPALAEREGKISLVTSEGRLVQDPNIEPSTPIPYYPSASVQTLLEEMSQFSQSRHSLALLLGPISSGKTTQMNLCKSQQADVYHLFHQHGKIDFYSSLANTHFDIGFSESEDTSQIFDLVIQKLKAQGAKGILFLVDDADQLSTQALQTLLYYFATQSDPVCKMILSGEPAFEKRIMLVTAEMDMVVDFTVLTTKPLLLEEIKDYLAQVGQMSRTLSSEALQKIYLLSEGYPGRINRVAAQCIFEHTKTSPLLRKKRFSLIDTILLLAILALVFVIGRTLMQIALHDRGVSPKASAALVAPASSPAASEMPLSVIPSIEDAPEQLLIVQEPTVAALPPAMIHQKQKENLHKPQPHPVVSGVTTPTNGYTLQVMAGRDKSSLLALSKKMNAKLPMKLTTLQRGGQDWYVLTTGHFATSEAAHLAMSQLPKDLQKNQPWVRPVTALRPH